MTLFWILTGGLALAMLALLGLALMRGRRDTGPAEAFDLKVYRDQLKEVERDVARGVITAEDADRLRTEVSRRILSADAKSQAENAGADQPRKLGMAMILAMGVTLFGGSFGVYMQYGSPGYGDLALRDRIAAAADLRSNRPSQAEAEAQMPPTTDPEAAPEYMQLVERLRATVQERPNDLQGQTLLARSEATLGNYAAAYKAQQSIILIKGADATAKDYADLADMMILAAGGYVSPEAESVLEEVLTREPRNGVARYYGGLMMSQIGRPDAAFRMWEDLLAEGPATAPWIPPIRSQIEEMAFRAGQVNFQMPEESPQLRGPSAEDMANAQNMTPEERQEMIRGMVAGLGERLATEGGPPEDWARLISAYGVLGQINTAANIWVEAQSVFAENPQALAIVREGAVRAGVSGASE